MSLEVCSIGSGECTYQSTLVAFGYRSFADGDTRDTLQIIDEPDALESAASKHLADCIALPVADLQ